MVASENRKHGRQSIQLSDQLREAILSGVFLPGLALRQEEIAQRFSVSRMPVREALRILAAEGLVT
ncbi:MAG: winged helix-turn-helix domain-containing protein, partial [Alphaproteobacteria bacterium]|nr:winged helix-turn-helix domain-containing protein [Alphaproteobacteria bacterium]